MFRQWLIEFGHDFNDVEQKHSSSTHYIFIETIRCSNSNVRLHQIPLKSQRNCFHTGDMFPFIHIDSGIGNGLPFDRRVELNMELFTGGKKEIRF